MHMYKYKYEYEYKYEYNYKTTRYLHTTRPSRDPLLEVQCIHVHVNHTL